jgi:hypothetical protein
MDISLEGMGEIDQTSRGPKHFSTIQRFLLTVPYHLYVNSLFVSSTLTTQNSDVAHLKTFSSWITDHFARPQLALLLLYPNHNVAPELALHGDDIRRIVDHAVSISSRYEDIFLEVFPGSIPNLYELIEDNILPGAGEVFRDEVGVLCGHVADNLFIRYVTPTDLLRYHLRISPEGMVLTPSGIEQPDYAQGNLGDITVEDFSIVQKRIREVIDRQTGMAPRECRDKRCFEICGAGNRRCTLFNSTPEQEWGWQPVLLSVQG